MDLDGKTETERDLKPSEHERSHGYRYKGGEPPRCLSLADALRIRKTRGLGQSPRRNLRLAGLQRWHHLQKVHRALKGPEFNNECQGGKTGFCEDTGDTHTLFTEGARKAGEAGSGYTEDTWCLVSRFWWPLPLTHVSLFFNPWQGNNNTFLEFLNRNELRDLKPLEMIKNINIIQMPLKIINKNDISKGLERTLIFVFTFFSVVPDILCLRL